jgi:hypothetical protein
MPLEGAVQISKAVFARLQRDGVEESIKARYWSNQISDPAVHRAIWKTRAPAGIQVPYAIYSLVSDTLVQQSNGTAAEVLLNDQFVAGSGQGVQYRRALIQFTCYATKQVGSDETTAIGVADLIVDAMENGKLSFSDGTRFITLHRQSDIETSDDEDNAVIGIAYQVDYEMIVNMDRMRA